MKRLMILCVTSACVASDPTASVEQRSEAVCSIDSEPESYGKLLANEGYHDERIEIACEADYSKCCVRFSWTGTRCCFTKEGGAECRLAL